MSMEFTGERFVPSLQGDLKYEHLHRYALSIYFGEGKTVLDLASGEGYGSYILAQVAKTVIGIDIDSVSIDYAKNQYSQCTNLQFMVGSCESIPLENNSVDLVTSFETIEHHDKHDEMMQEIKRVLKPNGVLILSSPNRLTYSDQPNYSNPYHVKELYYDELCILLEKYFKYTQIYGQKLEASSFVYPLENSQQNNYKAFSGDVENIFQRVAILNSPIYFIAICSDEIQQISTSLDSIYVDTNDSLLSQIKSRWESVQFALEESQNDLKQVQQQCTLLQQELDNSQAQWQEKYALLQQELDNSQAQWQEKYALLQQELDNSQAQWQEKYALLQQELDNSQAQWQNKEEEYKAKCEYIHQEWQKTQNILKQTQEQWNQNQIKLEQTQQKWEQAEQLIEAMESSKFWKIRRIWFKFKHLIGIKTD